MALGRHFSVKTEGGQGGKRGHSNMSHRERTGPIKHACGRLRRQVSRLLSRAARQGAPD